MPQNTPFFFFAFLADTLGSCNGDISSSGRRSHSNSCLSTLKVSDSGKGREDPPCGKAPGVQRGHLLATAQTTDTAGCHERGKQRRKGFLFYSSPCPPSKSTHDNGTLCSSAHLPDTATAPLPTTVRVLGLATHLSKHLKNERKNSSRTLLLHSVFAAKTWVLPGPQRPLLGLRVAQLPAASLVVSPAASHSPRCPRAAAAVCSAASSAQAVPLAPLVAQSTVAELSLGL